MLQFTSENGMDTTTANITARSRREAMDWSLVLASQGISATILNTEETWSLAVDDRDFHRAQASIRQYCLENRGWRWKQKLPGSSGLIFHWGSLLWVAGISGMYYWTMTRFPDLQRLGLMDSTLVKKGEWWRIFTAVTLHADLRHLAGNASTGALLLGLAMARYGFGVALLVAFLAGAAGNVGGLILFPDHHQSLGASGMVMGALGLLAVQSFSLWRKFRPGQNILIRAVLAATLLLILMGFSPGTDVVAHVGGFFAGAIFGFALNYAPPVILQKPAVNFAGAILLLGIVITTWRRAIIGP